METDFEDFKKEFDRRLNLVIKNLDNIHPIESGLTGSSVRFCMNLAICGYPLKPKEWMDEEYLKPLITFEIYSDDESEYMKYVNEKEKEFYGKYSKKF